MRQTRHIGDDYHEFTCTCGEIVLFREGDKAHLGRDGLLCGECGKGKPLVILGSKSNEFICELCRRRLPPEIKNGFFPTTQEDGEVTSICDDCQKLDPEGEEWKNL